jgi:hypothetical protein
MSKISVSVGLLICSIRPTVSVLLESYIGNILRIPRKNLEEKSISLESARNFFEKITAGVSSSWVEFELVSLEESPNKIFIIYGVLLPQKTSIIPGYEWVEISKDFTQLNKEEAEIVQKGLRKLCY